jgi:hypothetical protein
MELNISYAFTNQEKTDQLKKKDGYDTMPVFKHHLYQFSY